MEKLFGRVVHYVVNMMDLPHTEEVKENEMVISHVVYIMEFRLLGEDMGVETLELSYLEKEMGNVFGRVSRNAVRMMDLYHEEGVKENVMAVSHVVCITGYWLFGKEMVI